MSEFLSRTKALVGEDALNKLKNSRVALFGLGGVGSACFEALVRSGIGKIDVFDYDNISITNLNRQLLATREAVGTKKTEAAAGRAKQINPEAEIILHDMFYLPDTADSIDLKEFDYIIDAIDTVTAKLELISRAAIAEVPIISCMGTGNKMDLSKLSVTDISKTSGCPLARVMRKELRNRGINHLKVVYSDEKPYLTEPTGENKGNRPAPASAIFVPATAGLLLAQEVVKDLIK